MDDRHLQLTGWRWLAVRRARHFLGMASVMDDKYERQGWL